MDKGGYQSLLKSFSKSRPSPESTAEGQKSSVKAVVSTPKSVEELIAGAKAKSPEEIPGSARGRQPIGRIISGASGIKGHRGRQGVGTADTMARKPIADILQDSSRVRSLKTTATDQPQTPEKPVRSTEGTQVTLSTEKGKEENAAPPVNIKSRRVVFDFSKPTSAAKTQYHQVCEPKVRAKMIFDYFQTNISLPVQTIVYEHKLLDTKWKYGFAFDAMVINTVHTDTTDLTTFANGQCQTERIDEGCKWTQQPPTLQQPQPGTQVNGHQLFLESVGVSSDPPVPVRNDEISNPSPSTRKIKQEDLETEMLKFTKDASKSILSHLSSKSVHLMSSSATRENGLQFGRGLPHLEKLSMHTLHCDGHLIACANAPRKDPSGKGSRQDGKNIVTVWSVHQPTTPKYFLRVYGEVSKLKVELTAAIIVAGTYYGCLVIYDLREEERCHTFFQDVCVRNPSFHSGCVKDDNHMAKIIGIQILRESKTLTQIVSLDQDNVIICWSCTYLPGGDKDDLSGNTAAWSNLRVRARQVIHLSEMVLGTPLLSTNCLIAWEGEYKYFLVGTNNGFVAKGRIVSKQFPTYSEKFYGESKDSLFRILNLDLNLKLSLFLAVCDDKNVRLFDLSRQKAILSFECPDIPVRMLWSRRRLSVFYVAFKDEVAIWDMVTSDLSPVKKFQTNGLQEFELVEVGSNENMTMITDKGMKMVVVPPPIELSPLNDKEEELLRHYISIIH